MIIIESILDENIKVWVIGLGPLDIIYIPINYVFLLINFVSLAIYNLLFVSGDQKALLKSVKYANFNFKVLLDPWKWKCLFYQIIK